MKKILLPILFCFLVFIVKGQTNDTLICRTFGQLMGASSFNSTGYSINATYGEYNGCDINPSLMIAIIDSSSCQPMSTCGNDFGEQNQFTLASGSSCTDLDPFGTVSCGNRIHPWKLFK